MSPNDVREWLVPVASSISIVSVAVGVWRSLREYRLKLQAEARSERAAAVEADIRLLTLFSELMKTANGRSGYFLSEKTIEWFLNKTTPGEMDDLRKLRDRIEDIAVMTQPVGSAAQDSAIAAIAVLAERHEILRGVAAQALESLSAPPTSRVVARYRELVNMLEDRVAKWAAGDRRRLSEYVDASINSDPAFLDRIRGGEAISVPVDVTGSLSRDVIERIIIERVRAHAAAEKH